MRILKETIQNFYNLQKKCLNFFKFVGVLCFETTFRIQEFMGEMFWFLKTWKILKEIKTFERKKKYLRKDLWIVSENTFTRQIIVSYLHINSLSVTYLLTLYFVVFFVLMILKILLYNINNKWPTNYEMRCELQTGFCFKFLEQSNTLSCLFKKKIRITLVLQWRNVETQILVIA